MTDGRRHWSRGEILSLLGPVKRSGADTMAFCPAHPDGKKHGRKGGHSLVVHEDGTAKCFAGCSWPEIEAALIQAGGSAERPRDDRRRPPVVREPREDGAQWMFVEAYEYRTPDGKVALKGRHERPTADGGYEKVFWWRPPNRERWGKLDGTGIDVNDLLLWDSEEIAKLPLSQRVWFTEGENACKAVRKAGEPATTGAWGAHRTTFGEYGERFEPFEVFRGRNVILWPDNDEAGRKYMRAVRAALRGVAKSVVTVSAPVPPKGDAVEYFAGHPERTLDDLLAGVVLEPTVDVIAADRLTVRMPGDAGGVIAFEFADLHYKREELEANLTVRCDWEPETYDQFINLKSQSTREGLIRVLKAQFADKEREQNWTRSVTTAYSRVKAAYDAIPKGMQVDELPDQGGDVFMVEDLVPLGTSTVFFSLGGSGKSTLTRRLACEIAMGGEFLGKKVLRPGPVVIVDYEEPTGIKRELRRVLAGMDVDPDVLAELPIYFYPTYGESVIAHKAGIKRFCEEKEAVALLIDSAMYACGGEPEKSEVALAFFNALTFIGLTTMIVSHVTNADGEQMNFTRPYGNVTWRNSPRRNWALYTDPDDHRNPRDVLLECKKSNGEWPKALSYRMYFDHGPLGAIRFVRTEIKDTPGFARALPMEEQLRQVLAGEPGGLEVPEICERMSGNPKHENVRSALNRYKHLFSSETSGAGRGRRTLWKLAEVQYGCHRCGQDEVGMNDTGQLVCADHA